MKTANFAIISQKLKWLDRLRSIRERYIPMDGLTQLSQNQFSYNCTFDVNGELRNGVTFSLFSSEFPDMVRGNLFDGFILYLDELSNEVAITFGMTCSTSKLKQIYPREGETSDYKIVVLESPVIRTWDYSQLSQAIHNLLFERNMTPFKLGEKEGEA